MARPKGITANHENLRELVLNDGRSQKEIAGKAGVSLKTLQRALNGSRIDPSLLPKLGRVLGVDPQQLSLPTDKSMADERFAVIRLTRAAGQRDLPTDTWWTVDPEKLWRPKLKVELDVGGLNEKKAERLTQVTRQIETLMRPPKASKRIESLGKVDQAIRELENLGIGTYIGQYQFRKGAWPHVDLEEDEIGKPVIIDYTLVVFSDQARGIHLKRRVDQGMSHDNLKDSVYSVNEHLAEERAGTIHKAGREFLSQVRRESKKYFRDWTTHWGAVEEE